MTTTKKLSGAALANRQRKLEREAAGTRSRPLTRRELRAGKTEVVHRADPARRLVALAEEVQQSLIYSGELLERFIGELGAMKVAANTDKPSAAIISVNLESVLALTVLRGCMPYLRPKAVMPSSRRTLPELARAWSLQWAPPAAAPPTTSTAPSPTETQEAHHGSGA
jgi:hypothetical protein